MDGKKTITYRVKGMHCPSCETIIETRIGQIVGIKLVHASAPKGTVVIKYDGTLLDTAELNRMFLKNGYAFFEETDRQNNENKNIIGALIVGAAIIGVFLLANRLGVSRLIAINKSSSFWALFIFGLVAGFSTCAALVGGIVLSMSDKWQKTDPNGGTAAKLKPHLLFNFGRVVSYAAFGFVLGIIGRQLQLSPVLGAVIVVLVSLMMAAVGLNMLGIRWFGRLIPRVPKKISQYVSNENNFNRRFLPFLIGASTLILPCGFTITAQGLAMISGDPLKGLLIMLAFVLGTVPGLLAIGFTSVKLSGSRHAGKFSVIAGAVILFFALFNINAQMNVLGLFSLTDINTVNNQNAPTPVDNQDGLPLVINGKQIVKMDASSYGYNPSRLKVRVNVPVRWEITDKGTGGCTNAVIARDFFEGSIPLTLGQTSVKEFTPTKIGRYKFSCWMGMIVGTIEVIDPASL